MSCQIAHLFEHSEHLDRVARWIHAEFWQESSIHTPLSLAQLLRCATRPDAIPLSLLALVDGQPVGTVNLVENDDDNRRHLRPWLAALFVLPAYRRRGIGSALVDTLADRAASLGAASLDVDTLYLGTDIPNFYHRLGAKLHEQITDNFAILKLRHPNGNHESHE